MRISSFALLGLFATCGMVSCNNTDEEPEQLDVVEVLEPDTCSCKALNLSEDKRYMYLNSPEKPFNGVCEDRFANGDLQLRRHLTHGMNNGVSMEYFDNGQVKDSGEFVRNVRQGERKQYSRSGVLKYHAVYRDGQLVETIEANLKHPDQDDF